MLAIATAVLADLTRTGRCTSTKPTVLYHVVEPQFVRSVCCLVGYGQIRTEPDGSDVLPIGCIG